eukprot:gb/GECG01006759.1/.p1 GENE.gb/GECG01006759.1/~~gb/GECG01006759.1/.p1  ORF type:complete len:465 (+),score=62.68 gb/GECG01006759.1/:1-1395(+)
MELGRDDSSASSTTSASAASPSTQRARGMENHHAAKCRKTSHHRHHYADPSEYLPPHLPFILEDIDEDTQHQLRKLVFDMIFQEFDENQRRNFGRRFLGANPTLPGPLAITLSRDSIQKCLLQQEYWVCEKSDGERRILLILHTPPKNVVCQRGVYLIDRGFGIQRLADSEVYPDRCCENGNTLLDGELLIKDKQAKSLELREALKLANDKFYPEFLMFDAITYDGAAVGNLSLKERLDRIAQIRGKMKACAQEQRLPMRILGKYMLPLEKVEIIFDSIEKLDVEQGERTLSGGVLERRQYKDQSRWNDNDGIVFTPGRASYTDLIVNATAKDKTPLLKWKWKEHNTVDFLVLQEDIKREDLAIPLSVGSGGGHTTTVSMAKIDKQTRTKLDKTFKELQRGSLIVECSYNPQQSTWEMVRIRDRRNTPNFVKVAFHTLEVLVEDVTAEEITRSVRRRNGTAKTK